MDFIGKSYPRVDAENKVKGEALYPGDINLEDQAYIKILFSKFPHAIIRSIDISKALAIPGVLMVLTAKDVPTNEYGMIIRDQPVLCGPESSMKFADRTRCIGDQVAVIIANSERLAEKARDMIDVIYEPLPALFNPEMAMEKDAQKIHPELDSNVF